MRKFRPNERVVEGFQRVATSARAKVAQFLLKRAGIASHNIRVTPLSSGGVLTPLHDEPFAQYKFDKFFHRLVGNAGFRVMNCSRTSPSILELHFFLELPEGSELELVVSEQVDDIWRDRKGRDYAEKKELVQTKGEDPVRSFEIPVLENGRGLEVRDLTFSVRVNYPLDQDQKFKVGNDPDYRPPDEVIDRCKRAFRDLRSKSQMWIGIVLDSEELLPYVWRNEEQRYEPGFFTDGTLIMQDY
jgi:hypothetical protein